MDDRDSTAPITPKTCSKCGEAKPLSEFSRDRRRATNGVQSQCKACNAAYYVANRERVLADRATNRERTLAYWAAYAVTNRDRLRAQSRTRYEANRERLLPRFAAYRTANRDKRQEAWLRRRAWKRGAPVIERIYRAKVWARDGGRCHVCGRKADPSNWHLEHIVPLSRGGEHSYRNVAVSHPACNLRKGAQGAGQPRLQGFG